MKNSANATFEDVKEETQRESGEIQDSQRFPGQPLDSARPGAEWDLEPGFQLGQNDDTGNILMLEVVSFATQIAIGPSVHSKGSTAELQGAFLVRQDRAASSHCRSCQLPPISQFNVTLPCQWATRTSQSPLAQRESE
jgi:hypothetical protein